MNRQERLVERAIQGDKKALEQLLLEKQRDILYIAIRFSDIQEAEDLAHDAIVNIIQGIGSLRDPRNFNSWMYTVVRHACFNQKRKKKNNPVIHLSSDEEDFMETSLMETRTEFMPTEFVENEEKRKIVIEALETLPNNLRETMVLFYYSQLSYKEIADVLEVNEKKVANSLVRGKEMFRKRLKERIGEEIYLSVAPIGAIPVLTRLLQEDARTVVTSDMSARLMKGLPMVFTVPKATAASSAGLAKILAGSAVVFSLAAGAAVIHQPQQAAGRQEFAPVKETTAQVVHAKAASAAIITLADMIGTDRETQLLSFEADGTSDSEWSNFIAAIDAWPDGQTTATNDYEYQRYELVKQSKRLILGVKHYRQSDQVVVMHLFGDKDLPAPRMAEMIAELDAK